MFCDNCGAIKKDKTDKFCSECGYEFGTKIEMPDDEKVIRENSKDIDLDNTKIIQDDINNGFKPYFLPKGEQIDLSNMKSDFIANEKDFK